MSTTHKYDESPDPPNVNHQPETFGLPAAPLSTGRETSLLDAPVIAWPVQGKPLRGLLQHFNQTKNELVINTKQTAHVTIHFDELRFLFFSQPLLPASGTGSRVNNNGPDFQAGKVLQLVFRDGLKFQASTGTVLTNPSGLHIFLDKPDGQVCRVFVPGITLKNHRLETAADNNIENQREAGAIDIDQPSDEIPLATILDSDNTSISPPVTSCEELIERLDLKWPIPSQHLGELLFDRHIINRKQISEILLLQEHHSEDRIGELLKQGGIATADEIYSTLAYKLGLQYVKPDAFNIDLQTLTSFPKELAIRFHAMPLLTHNNRLIVAMSDPTNTDACRMLEFATQHRIETVLANGDDILSAIDKFYSRREDDEAIEEFREFVVTTHNSEEETREAERQSMEKPIVRLVHNMIIDGVHKKASDIHVRPGENSVDIILRIDGTLIPVRNFTKSMHAAVVSRIKIIGRMDISERRIPQDGRASISLHGNKIDLRISVMPTINGESVVIRILDTNAGLRSIDQLGFGERDYNLFRDMISHSYGILLVTGPTGSGKSTTLYAALEHIRKTNVNIITAEDPVEYHIDGIEQMQVNHQIDYSFSRILRNILRHDPDVIMVGEIRDQETAKTAIESALTGHLVLSTLHTNSAAVTVTRLLEMGVEPYLINDTLLGVLAQRLVRANCPECLVEEEAAPSIYQSLGVDTKDIFYRGKGCDNCHHTGYKGRLAVYELLKMDADIRSLVLGGVSADIIHAQAVSSGMIALTQNALAMAKQKKTSLAEVYRIRLE